MSDARSTGEVEKVDIPIEVPRRVAEQMADDLDQTGSITVEIQEDNCPSLTDQIRWQLENDQQILKFVEDYDA